MERRRKSLHLKKNGDLGQWYYVSLSCENMDRKVNKPTSQGKMTYVLHGGIHTKLIHL
jgi:hypothetical protein